MTIVANLFRMLASTAVTHREAVPDFTKQGFIVASMPTRRAIEPSMEA